MPTEKIEIDAVYTHDADGVHYRVLELINKNATGYERDHSLGPRIIHYLQLEDGEKCPAGADWYRLEPDFKEQFTPTEQ